MRLLLFLVVAVCAVSDDDEIWVVSPESGTVLTGGAEQELLIALRLGQEAGGARELYACLETKRIDDDESETLEHCFDASISGQLDKVLESSMTVVLSPPGWHRVSIRLFAGSRHAAVSSVIADFAIAVYLPRYDTNVEEGRAVGLAWDYGGSIGWGVAGLHVALALADQGVDAVPLRRVHGYELSAWQRRRLESSLERRAHLERRNATSTLPIVHGLGRWGKDGGIGKLDESLWSEVRNVGLLFAETTEWSRDDLEKLARFDAVLVGSTWLGEVLTNASDRLGVSLPRLETFSQGIDSSLFFPASAIVRRENSRFRVFSGGKLEWRKGQDIAIAGFKRFRELTPQADAQLVVSWANPWRVTVQTMANATHTVGVPRENSEAALVDWLEANGVSRDDVIALASLAHSSVPDVLHAVDVAVFPNRAEGGTNLVAMEAAASGLPIILAANTGQLDLVAALGHFDGCWPLLNQTPSKPPLSGVESDPEELAANLASVFHDQAAARARARRGALRMKERWAWKPAVDVLAKAVFDDDSNSKDAR